VQGIFHSEFAADLFFLDYLGFQKDGVLDQEQLIAIIAQGMGLFDRLFFDYFRTFVAECALPQKRRKFFQQRYINQHEQTGQQYREFKEFNGDVA
jgi:predicted ATP-dependent Lon-type protease